MFMARYRASYSCCRALPHFLLEVLTSYLCLQAKVDQVPKLRESLGKLQERCKMLEKINDKVTVCVYVYFVYCVYGVYVVSGVPCCPHVEEEMHAEFLNTHTAAGTLFFAVAP